VYSYINVGWYKPESRNFPSYFSRVDEGGREGGRDTYSGGTLGGHNILL